MLTQEQVDKYSDMVAIVSSSYHKMYKMLNKDDIAQEVWMWFLTHPRKVKEWESLEDERDATKLLAKSLRNAAHDYCVKEKAKVEGYDPSDLFYYQKDMVKALLPAALSNDYKRIMAALGEGSRSGKSPSESGDWMAFAADIRSAFEKLNDEERNLVYNFYAIDVDGMSLHEAYGANKSTARATMMAANRALNKMVKNLGGFRPFKDTDYPHSGEDEDGEDVNDMQELL